MLTSGFILFSGTVAFVMVLAEFVLVGETSAVTFTVAGSLKELLTVFAGVVIFGDKISAVNGAGLGILIIGVVLYNRYKLKKLKEQKSDTTKELELQNLDDLEDQNLLDESVQPS